MTDDDITDLLVHWDQRDPAGMAELIPRVYAELRRLAGYHFSAEGQAHTLQPTALVSELYLRLVGSKLPQLGSRRDFFTVASRLMREILVDHARARQTLKRGGNFARVTLDDSLSSPSQNSLDPATLLAIDAALDRLKEIDEEQARIAELRYFTGLTIPETAQVVGISRATAERRWSLARRWLAHQLAS